MSKILKSYRFDEHTLELIEGLREELHLSSSSDVLRRALTLLKLAVDNQSRGGSVVLKSELGDREVLL